MSRLKRVALAACLLLGAASAPLAQGEPALHRERGRARRGGRAPAGKPDVAALVRALGGRSADAANEAAEALAEAGAEAVPALAEALKSGRTQTRLYAALALSTIEPKRADALEVLRHIVRDRREYYLTRRHAAFALARTAAGVRALATMLGDEDDEVRLSAAFAFEELSEGGSDDPAGPHAELVRGVPALVAALKDRNGVVRGVVGETLGQLGPDAERHLPPREAGDAREEAGALGRDPEPTPEEAREARTLALLFLARARLTGDLEFAAREMLVEDFAGRLQRELVVGGNFLDDFFDDRLAEQARPEELGRFYWSLLNFVSAGQTHLDGRKEADGGRPALDEAFPPQVVAVIERSEAFGALVNKLWGVLKVVEPGGGGVAESPRAVRVSAQTPAGEPAPRGGRKEEPPRAGSDALIKSARELKAFTADADEAARRLREHRAAHAEPGARAAGAKGGERSAEEAGGEDTAGPPKVTILGKSFYGYPAKTRLICVDVTPAGGAASFHLDFVPVNGKLRLLTVIPQ